MDLRPQGPEIIRTWLFDTVVRAHFEHGTLPWTRHHDQRMDPRPRPQEDVEVARATWSRRCRLLEQYGADAVRYWAANGRPGTDTAVDEGQMKVGRRLAIKLLNASKFALGVAGDAAEPDGAARVTEPLDRSMLAALADLVDDVDRRLRGLRLRPGARADRAVLLGLLRRLPRAGEAARVRRDRARAVRSRPAPRSRIALSTLQRLFAPFLCS